MIDIIQAKICEGLETCITTEGTKLLDKFTSFDIGHFSTIIYSCLPMYTDELVDVVLEQYLSFLSEEEKTLFVRSKINILLKDIILNKKEDYNTLISITFWFNLYNKIINKKELQEGQEDFKDFIKSFLYPNVQKLQKEIEQKPALVESREVGDYFIRVSYKDNIPDLFPSSKTEEEFKELLTINSNKNDR